MCAQTTRNESDLGPLTALIHATAPHLSPGTTAVVLSQVAPGYMRQLRTELRELSPADFYYQVETLIFGRAVERAMQPERLSSGPTTPPVRFPRRCKHGMQPSSVRCSSCVWKARNSQK